MKIKILDNFQAENIIVSFVVLCLSIMLLSAGSASYCTEQLAAEQSCILISPIKYPLNIKFSECAVDDECEIFITGDNKSVKNASIVISGAVNISGYTDDTGRFKFSPEIAGDIKIKAEKEGYYSAEGNFHINKSKNIEISIPDKINVNEMFNINVKNSKGKGIRTNISISTPDGKIINTETDKNGDTKFTPETPGKYKITVNDKNYEGEKEFIAYGKLNIVCPDKVKFKEKFRVNVVDENNNSVDAIIKIPELNKEINNGEDVVAEKCGDLNLIAEKEYYEKASKKIFVENKKLNLTGKDKLNAKENYLYFVRDEDGNPVKNAQILINETFIGTTDTNGSIEIKIENAGNYIISAKKECYDDVSLAVEVTEFSLMNLLWLLILLILLLLLLLLLLKKYKSQESREEEISVFSPFGIINNSTKIVKIKDLNISGSTPEAHVYVYVIAKKEMKNCKIVETIPTDLDVTVITLGAERLENNLLLNLGDLHKGDVRILNYIIYGKCEIKNAQLVYDGGKEIIPVKYV